MNERIKELAAKAYLSVNPGPDPYNEAEAAWLGFGPFERKFAELIVRECLTEVKKEHFRRHQEQLDPVITRRVNATFRS